MNSTQTQEAKTGTPLTAKSATQRYLKNGIKNKGQILRLKKLYGQDFSNKKWLRLMVVGVRAVEKQEPISYVLTMLITMAISTVKKLRATWQDGLKEIITQIIFKFSAITVTMQRLDTAVYVLVDKIKRPVFD